MDDALILSCGHSYGSSGMQHVYRMVCQKNLHSPDTVPTFGPRNSVSWLYLLLWVC
jgi:hypothetical protein